MSTLEPCKWFGELHHIYRAREILGWHCSFLLMQFWLLSKWTRLKNLSDSRTCQTSGNWNERSPRCEGFYNLFFYNLLPPATKLGQGCIFTGISDSVNRGACVVDACVVAQGGRSWLLGGACVVAQGVCVVALGGCMVAPRGVHGFCQGGVCAFFRGGMHGFFWGACMVFSKGACIGYDEIRSMSGWYASYWNAFLFNLFFENYKHVSIIHSSNNVIIWNHVQNFKKTWVVHDGC